MNLLLIEPNFPIASKSKNHASFLPIALLKIGSYYKNRGDRVQLIRGNLNKVDLDFRPDKIYITSLFTYWSKYVKQSVEHYKNLFPDIKITVGGVFASLMPDQCKRITGCDSVKPGLYKKGKIETIKINYSLLSEPINYQIVHSSRGCFRKCSFCGTWKIEKQVSYKDSIKDEIQSNLLVFYDNNILANPNIEIILDELAAVKFNKRTVYSECQSGFDGRILLRNPNLSQKLRLAHFINPRIAWDGPLVHFKAIKNQIDILSHAGYKAKRHDADIYLFMLYNYLQSYDELCEKLEYCRRWGVLVIDCRFRPLNQLYDNYNPRKKSQTSEDYYIHPNWTDTQIRNFRRKVRRQNIAIRLGLPQNKYIEGVESRYVSAK
jgi:hypothetical protein